MKIYAGPARKIVPARKFCTKIRTFIYKSFQKKIRTLISNSVLQQTTFFHGPANALSRNVSGSSHISEIFGELFCYLFYLLVQPATCIYRECFCGTYICWPVLCLHWKELQPAGDSLRKIWKGGPGLKGLQSTLKIAIWPLGGATFLHWRAMSSK